MRLSICVSEMILHFQDIDLSMIKDFEDPAIGAGILSQNESMFNVKDQIEWLKNHSRDFNRGRQIVEALQVSNISDTIMLKIYYSLIVHRMQKAGRDFLAGIGANIGGGSRRMPELCCITLEVTASNPTRSFRKVLLTPAPTIIHPLIRNNPFIYSRFSHPISFIPPSVHHIIV